MSDRFDPPPTTEEHSLLTDTDNVATLPCLLGAFPVLVGLRIPRMGEIVGRAWLDDAGITDTNISREHISFSRPGGRLHIKDHRSQNGTFVDGVRLEPDVATPIDDGSLVRLGQTIFVYREAFADHELVPREPLGKLVGPWALDKIRRALFARTYRPNLNVLLEGAIGTGTELLAAEVARQLRPGTKFVAVNMATLPRDAFEGNLFGWEKNSFTGAFQTYSGSLRSASGGAVFLDEIEALPVEVQPKLMRFIEKRQVQPLGAQKIPDPVDCLVIAATNCRLSELVNKDAFFRDFVARFQLRFTLPALEDRPEDLYAILAAHWERTHQRKLDPTVTRVDAEAIERLMRHDWRENVRELCRVVESFDPRVGIKKSALDRLLGPEPDVPISRRGDVLTRETVASALAECGENQNQAAKVLGVNRAQLLHWWRKNAKTTGG